MSIFFSGKWFVKALTNSRRRGKAAAADTNTAFEEKTFGGSLLLAGQKGHVNSPKRFQSWQALFYKSKKINSALDFILKKSFYLRLAGSQQSTVC